MFWLFVAAVGFLYGWSIAPMIWNESSPVMFLLVAVLCGLVGAVLGVFFQKLAVGFAGGLMGGYLVWALVHGTNWEAQHFTEIPFLIGAVIGAILVLVLFDWALIIWSSITGSILIVQTFQPAPMLKGILFLALAALGIAIQTYMFRSQRAKTIVHSDVNRAP